MADYPSSMFGLLCCFSRRIPLFAGSFPVPWALHSRDSASTHLQSMPLVNNLAALALPGWVVTPSPRGLHVEETFHPWQTDKVIFDQVRARLSQGVSHRWSRRPFIHGTDCPRSLELCCFGRRREYGKHPQVSAAWSPSPTQGHHTALFEWQLQKGTSTT